jgi:hypothetical protein
LAGFLRLMGEEPGPTVGRAGTQTERHHMKFTTLGPLALGLMAIAASGCDLFNTGGPKRMRVKAELIRLQSQGAAGAMASLAHGGAAGAYPEESTVSSSAFELQSFKMPVRAIYLTNATNDRAIDIYQCEANSNDACLVELFGPALQDMLGTNPIPVSPGTFNELVVLHCLNSEQAHTLYVRGTINLGGTTYGTKANGTLSPDGAPEDAAVPWSGCGRSFLLLEPIHIAEEGENEIIKNEAFIPVRMYYDLEGVVWGATRGAWENWNPQGCPIAKEQAEAGTPFFCVGYANIAGTIDKTPPKVERYRVGSSATVVVYFRASDDAPLSGYNRRHYEFGIPYEPLYRPDMPFMTVLKQPDGSLRLETGPSNGASGPIFPAFRRENHTGSVMGNGILHQYTAVKVN